ncbi:hypothetical protein EVG20_g6577 [Dentipellis fragilis]|uniref:Uncharacterized protein n=1 Tax=Dentipellis fragilis TaxID=205917 RepID=A0A4Y9YMS3_9AGAM|nr:hypothetical protein EVG20_g6577 [Dentipellis fragilis]
MFGLRHIVFKALSTSQRKTRPYHPRPWFSTLDPARLSPDDYCDLSGKPNVEPLADVKRHKLARFNLYYGTQDFRRAPFPPGTHGFFYYRPTSPTRASDNPDGRPENGTGPGVGELRFRVTQSSDPASFAEGHDLRHTDGLPWSVPSERIATNPAAGYLRAILLRDGLISEEQLEREREHVRRRGVSSHGVVSRRIVSGLGQPFFANLGRKNWCIVVDSVAGPAGPERKRVHLENPYLQPDRRPYFSGRMVCCLERSPLPEHANLHRLVIRVLKITDPLAPLAPLPLERAMDVPVEGALVSRKGSPRLIRVYALLQLLLGAKCG